MWLLCLKSDLGIHGQFFQIMNQGKIDVEDYRGFKHQFLKTGNEGRGDQLMKRQAQSKNWWKRTLFYFKRFFSQINRCYPKFWGVGIKFNK